MDAFEDLIARLLRREGFWTRQNYRVNLTKEEKRAVDRPSLPRPDIDILAYKPVDNVLAWVECKSYLDSGGVHIAAFDGSNEAFANRFKMFTKDRYREVVSQALIRQVTDERLTLPNPRLEFWLIAGNINAGSRESLAEFFANRGWTLRDSSWIIEQLRSLGEEDYENDVVMMTIKLLSRQRLTASDS